MSTYRDTDVLIELIDYYILHDKDAYKNHSALFVDGMKDGYYRIRSNIINLPSADVVEVVRCKECENWDAPYCSVLDDAFDEKFFCALGERRKKG